MDEQAGPVVDAGAYNATDLEQKWSDRVLVVEDDPYLRRVVVRILEGWGYLISEASDGVMALEQFGRESEDLALILLDIMLPVLNGVEVARRMLADRPQLPILACSAAMTEGIEEELRLLGVRNFLHKPYTAESLRDSLRVALSK